MSVYDLVILWSIPLKITHNDLNMVYSIILLLHIKWTPSIHHPVRFHLSCWLCGKKTGGTRDCDGLDEKAHQGSKVENVGERYENQLIAVTVFKKCMNSLHHVGGVQKGGNISTPVCPTWSLESF